MHSKATRAVTVILATLVIAYLVIAVLLFFTQRSFIYPAPAGAGAQPAGFESISYRTKDGLDLQAGYRAAQAGQPTVIYFHGNAADWQSSVVATDRLTPAGYGVLAAEYRGYRGNPGKPSEQALYADGRAAFEWLASQRVERSDVIIVGNSIGTGVATQMAVEHQPRALVLISPFASLSQLVAEKLPWLPTRLLLRDQFHNDAKLADIHAPILIMHGDADSLIPIAHARQLASSTSNAQLIEFENIGHDLAWYDAAEMAMLRFVESPLPQESET